MPSWNDLLDQMNSLPDDKARTEWLRQKQTEALAQIKEKRGNRNVLFYASAFLQKPNGPEFNLQITHEDVNGFMSTIYGMDWDKGLTILLHTPGGVTNATESIVSYLWSKFSDIEVIIPLYAMSAGTMISLAANRIIMGRQSQLGPIDPQMPFGGRFVSARAIVDQFETAKEDISNNKDEALVWAPVLQSIGPALLQEAQNALEYGERMVADWLAQRMFKRRRNAKQKASEVAAYFNDASIHKSHGRRIDRKEAKQQKLRIESLEDNQELQEAVLTLYHIITILFEKTPTVKVLVADTGRMWIKNWIVSQPTRR